MAPWRLRAALSLLSAVAPRLAGRAGERMFLSPPSSPAPARERETLARWKRFEVRHRSRRLAAWRTGAGPVVVLAHGWGGRGGQLAGFAPALVDAGCSVVTFDGPAHGESPGRLASVVLFSEAIADVARATGARAVVAHSMGGAATALAVVRGLDLDAFVSIGAPRTPATFFHAFADALALTSAARSAIRARIEARVAMRLEELDLPRLAPRDGAVPMLVVHDRDDAEVPFSSAVEIASAWGGAELHATTGLGHRRVLRDRGVVERAVSFVAGHLPRCACGRLATSAATAGEDRCGDCELSDELWMRSRRQSLVGAAR